MLLKKAFTQKVNKTDKKSDSMTRTVDFYNWLIFSYLLLYFLDNHDYLYTF